MKRKRSNMIWIAIVILLLLGIVAFYLYDVIFLKRPYTDRLFRMLASVFLLLGTLVKLVNIPGRKGLEFYEKAYENELGYAFKNKPLQRKKLLCACRLYNESNYRKALKYLFQLLRETEFERDAIPVLLFIALCYTDAGVPGEAIKVYYDLLKIDPKNARVHSNLGGLFIAEGDFETALKHYNKSIELKPENYYAYVNRANYYFRINEYDNAITDAKQALEFKNNGAEAASLLTIVYALLGDEESKKKYYHLSLTAGKKPEELNEAIRYFLSEQNIPSDEEELYSDEETMSPEEETVSPDEETL